ncbi:MAG: phosphoribosylglycinamide formyltransferase [Acidobacteriota bacterium]|jgi:phosphoribosylglycinamide formyltransferase-1
MKKRVGILLSGRGSNFLALSDAIEAGQVPAEIALVVSNRENAPGLEHARKRGYRTVFISSKGKEREAFDREVVAALHEAQVEIVCLAGFMRLLSASFVREFPQRILNIHPSLLPAFPGLHAQRQALEWGVKVSGCTVHLVDEDLDHGPIIVQQAVAVEDGDDEDSLSARILEQEHRIYPMALKRICEGGFRIVGRRLID